MKLHEFFDHWLSLRANGLAPSTKSGYKSTFAHHINAIIGELEVDTITSLDILRCITPLCDAGHTRAAQLTLILLRAILKDAVFMGLTTLNPALAVRMPKHRKQESKYWTPQVIHKFLRANAFSPLYPIWVLALCLGLRRGELLGLRWTDVDLAGAVLHIRNQRVLVEGTTYESAPKSSAGCRDLPLAPKIIKILRAHRLRSALSEYVLCDEHGKPYTAMKLSRALDAACLAAEVPRVTLHGLRHSMATAAITEGASIKTLQSILGHAHYQTTADIYTHVIADQRIDALASTAQALL